MNRVIDAGAGSKVFDNIRSMPLNNLICSSPIDRIRHNFHVSLPQTHIGHRDYPAKEYVRKHPSFPLIEGRLHLGSGRNLFKVYAYPEAKVW